MSMKRQLTRFVIVYCALFLSGMAIAGYAQTVIKLEKDGNVYKTSCLVNGLKMKLYISTGSDDVSLSIVEARFMLKNGYLTKADFSSGREYFEMANGDIVEGTKVNIKTIDIGGIVLRNVKASVLHAYDGPVAMGQTALARLGKVTIDYKTNTMIIDNGKKAGGADNKKADADLIQLVHVDGGSFTMGNDFAKDEEAPAHPVKVKGFYMGKYEVTVAQFRTFVDATGYTTTAETEGNAVFYSQAGRSIRRGINWKYNTNGALHTEEDENEPVLFTSWFDALRFCEWMSEKTGKHYRLPTEAEWEFAAKGGNKSKNTVYSGSSDIEEVGWYKGNSGWNMHKVGMKRPNELGIYDMTGGMLEYCADWFEPNYYKYAEKENPRGPKEGKERVTRGGAIHNDAKDCRNTDRHWDEPYSRCNYNGFRVAVDE